MTYRLIKYSVEIEAVDIPTMVDMDAEEYRDYLKNSLFFTDHHGVFRSSHGEYPIVTSREQLHELIRYLNEDVAPLMER